MPTLIEWVRKRKEEFRLLWKYWPPLAWDSFISAIVSWFNIFIVGILSIVYSLLITIYKGEQFDLKDFFPPNYLSGLILALITFFVYKLLVDIAKKLDSWKNQANRMRWEDVDFRIYEFPNGSGFKTGIRVISNKPSGAEFDIYNCEARITMITERGQNKYSGSFENSIFKLKLLQGNKGVYRETKSILRKTDLEESIIVLADYNDTYAKINADTTDNQRDVEVLNLDKNIIYRIRIRIHGSYDAALMQPSNIMTPCEVFCDLIYHKDKNGQMKVFVSNMQNV